MTYALFSSTTITDLTTQHLIQNYDSSQCRIIEYVLVVMLTLADKKAWACRKVEGILVCVCMHRETGEKGWCIILLQLIQ